jgi:thiol-disulfide isomerase/thioredoxin
MPAKPAKPTPAERRAARRAAEVAAAAEAAQRQRRERLTRVVAPIVVVLVVIVALVVVKVASGGSKPRSGQNRVTAATTVIQQVTHVPAAALNTVGIGSVKTAPTAISAAALTAGKKPLVLYVGAEWCPFCATERWGVVVALSRFGAFANLGQTASSPSDKYPNTATLSFHGATYTSSRVAFTGKETESNQVQGGSYTKLDTLTVAETALAKKYGGGGIPFIDIGGKYTISGASFSPGVLQSKTHAQIAAALSDPTSPIAQGVDGTANLVTAAICQSTAQQPASVCQATGVLKATATLTGSS